MMGLLHSKNNGARNEGLFLKRSIHFTLNTIVCLFAVTKTNTRILNYPCTDSHEAVTCHWKGQQSILPLMQVKFPVTSLEYSKCQSCVLNSNPPVSGQGLLPSYCSQIFSATRMPFLIPALFLGHHDNFFGFSTEHATVYLKDCHY